MAEDVRVSADGTFILVTSSGSPSLEEMKRTLARIAQLKRDHQIGSVLVDSRARRVQPSMAVNRGGMAAFFSDEELAARWLSLVSR